MSVAPDLQGDAQGFGHLCGEGWSPCLAREPRRRSAGHGNAQTGKNKGGAGERSLAEPGTAGDHGGPSGRVGVSQGPLQREGRAAAEPALQKHRPTSPGKWLVCVGSMAAAVREAQGRGCLSLASVAFWEGFALTKPLS